MINKQKEGKIRSEISPIIAEAFTSARNNEKYENDYILFLGLAEKEHKSTQLLIGSNVELYKHDQRSNIIKKYLDETYKLSKKEYQEKLYLLTTVEMMFYTHIWESTLFLKVLKNLSNLVSGKSYDWTISIPPFGRNDFILKIIDDFRIKEIGIAKLLNDIYDKDYRNAFAHNEFSFPITNSQSGIRFYTKNQTISFENWQSRFLKAISLENIILSHFFSLGRQLPDGLEFDVRTENSTKSRILIKQYDNNPEFSWCSS